MQSVVDETSSTRRFRLSIEALFVAVGASAAVGLIVAGRPLLACGPGALVALVLYAELSTYDRIEALGGGRLRLRRRLGTVEVKLEEDAHVRESWFGPRTIYLCQGTQTWKIFGTLGGSIQLDEWIDRQRRRSTN